MDTGKLFLLPAFLWDCTCSLAFSVCPICVSSASPTSPWSFVLVCPFLLVLPHIHRHSAQDNVFQSLVLDHLHGSPWWHLFKMQLPGLPYCVRVCECGTQDSASLTSSLGGQGTEMCEDPQPPNCSVSIAKTGQYMRKQGEEGGILMCISSFVTPLAKVGKAGVGRRQSGLDSPPVELRRKIFSHLGLAP